MAKWLFELVGDVLTCHDPAGRQRAQVTLAEDDYRGLLKWSCESKTALEDRRHIGRTIYHWLTHLPEIEAFFEQACRDGILWRVCGSHSLGKVPWELVHDGEQFLAAGLEPHFFAVRRAQLGAHSPPVLPDRAARLLMMAFNPFPPRDAEEADVDFANTDTLELISQEEALVLEALVDLTLEVQVEDSGNLTLINEALHELNSNYFEMIHLRGRFVFHEGAPCLITENQNGLIQYARDSRLVLSLAPQMPRLLVLIGFDTGEAEEEAALQAMARDLVGQGAPAVLTWLRPAGDPSVRTACAELYRNLSEGLSVIDAVQHVRALLNASSIDGWHNLLLHTDQTAPVPLANAVHAALRCQPGIPNGSAVLFSPAGSKSAICPACMYVGRRTDTQLTLNLLRKQQDGRAKYPGLVLYGAPGVGKSSLAARLRERLFEGRQVVLRGPLSEASLIRGLNDALNDPRAAEILDNDEDTLFDRLEMLLLEVMDPEPAVITFEDFEINGERGSDGFYETDEAGFLALKPEPARIFDTVVRVVSETICETQILVTSRFPVGPREDPDTLALYRLGAMDQADVLKKLRQLPILGKRGCGDPVIARRALAVAEGNPKLLELCGTVVSGPQRRVWSEDYVTRFLDELGKVALDRRLDRAWVLLLEVLTPEARKLLGYLVLIQVPITCETLHAIVGDEINDSHLQGLLEMQLVSVSHGTVGDADRYYVAPGVGEVMDDLRKDWQAVSQMKIRAARSLYRASWDIYNARQLAQAREAYRLACVGRESELAVSCGLSLAEALVSRSRFVEAGWICSELVTRFGEGYAVLREWARAELALGRTDSATQKLQRARQWAVTHPEHMREEDEAPLCAEAREAPGGTPCRDMLDQALSMLEDALPVFEDPYSVCNIPEEARGETASHYSLGLILSNQGRSREAGEHLRRALVKARKMGDLACQASVHLELGDLAMMRGEYERAQDEIQGAADLWERLGYAKGQAKAMLALARVQRKTEELEDAVGALTEALALAGEEEDRRLEAHIHREWGELLLENEDPHAALDHFKQACVLFKELREKRFLALALVDGSEAFQQLGRDERAESDLLKAAWILAEERAWHDLADTLFRLGRGRDPLSNDYLAQGLWLSLRIGFPLDRFLPRGYALMERLGPRHGLARLLARALPVLLVMYGDDHPKQREMLNEASSAVLGFIGADHINPETFTLWVAEHGLENPQQVLENLDRELAHFIHRGSWIPDRAYFQDFRWPEFSIEG
ncbi:CHAT domain-containing protein [Acanthopleuribacter pedis]|uniref:CHAT domain-containing protein n=1 Tax=Acanthopleuribacter pedis TaxID=442870 RepID=A0A8J7Q482_9BACT|nr:CHAT domain-containing protein [Acanthopleuribacter pedis]MBO1320272.1 CHAT domain-containing protein [Acanthopleuribacter pedis]